VRADGIRVILSDRRYVYRHLDDLLRAGVDPLAHKIVVVTLGSLMAPLRAIAPREILVFTRGYADMDFTRLPYCQVTRPIHPLDMGLPWRPVITNVAGYGENEP
jgi:microcystin degradation protein MlrC